MFLKCIKSTVLIVISMSRNGIKEYFPSLCIGMNLPLNYCTWSHTDTTESSVCIFGLYFIALKKFCLCCRSLESRSLTILLWWIFLLKDHKCLRKRRKTCKVLKFKNYLKWHSLPFRVGFHLEGSCLNLRFFDIGPWFYWDHWFTFHTFYSSNTSTTPLSI